MEMLAIKQHIMDHAIVIIVNFIYEDTKSEHYTLANNIIYSPGYYSEAHQNSAEDVTVATSA